MTHPMVKGACLAGALCGAAMLSQYPAFAQQYIQRLAGQVDALSEVVEDFDVSAFAAGFTRSEALAEMSGTPFLEARATDMRRTFARHVILTDQLARLRAATPVERITMVHEIRDVDTLRATWADFEPALPLSVAGAATGGVGFFGGWAVVALFFGALKRTLRQRPRKAPVALARVDPPLYRSETGPALRAPRLMGETRP